MAGFALLLFHHHLALSMMKNTFIKKKLIAQGANRNLEKKKKKNIYHLWSTTIRSYRISLNFRIHEFSDLTLQFFQPRVILFK